MMKIVWTNATPEQVKRDYEKVVAAHKKAMEENPRSWAIFGGTVTVNKKQYQVCQTENN